MVPVLGFVNMTANWPQVRLVIGANRSWPAPRHVDALAHQRNLAKSAAILDPGGVL